ncbi:MAG: hypothetical protein Q9170_005065 [Blastenia crenularia]
MNVSVRASSAPLLGSHGTSGETTFSNVSTDHATHKPGAKQPRSPGFLNGDNSQARLEFQDGKKSIDELKELARSTPPVRIAPSPVLQHVPATGLSRTDSGRRRRILEHIAESGNLPAKPFKRLLFRLNRSATTPDLCQDSIPRGSIEVASKESSSGRRYMKIALNPKIYGSENPSTYKVNFQDLNAKGEAPRWVGRRSKTRKEFATGRSETPEQASLLLNQNGGCCMKVEDKHQHWLRGGEIIQPAEAVANQTNNGYSPSKGIPKPDLSPDIRDFTAATLAVAQAHARKAGQVSTSPQRSLSQSRQPGLPVRNPGNHAGRRRASSKGPCSVPIKFQMRPQRASLPKTPRTSLDDPSTLKETSPVVNGKVKASSPVSCSDSVATDGQSDAESVQIMNAQSAELIHGQGTFGYHGRSSNKPPRSGPAPTRALPSLPEDRSNTMSRSPEVNKDAPSVPVSQLASGSSPKTAAAKSPPKGHRYRLSPVKNNLRKDVPTLAELKPSAKFTEEFPQPPRSLIPRTSSEAISPCRNGESGSLNTVTPYRNGNSPAAVDQTSAPSGASTTQSAQVEKRKSIDPDQDNLYLPWQESRVDRVDRVKALKARDLQRLRSGLKEVTSQTQTNEKADTLAEAMTTGKNLISPGQNDSPGLPFRDPKYVQGSNRVNAKERGRPMSCTTKMDVSPIVTVAEQPPCLANDLRPDSLYHNLPTENPAMENDACNHPKKVNGISDPHHQFLAPSEPVNRTSTPSSTTAGRLDPSSSSRRHSHASTSDLEARIASLEKKNLLLEKAFMAVIDASSGFSLSNLHGGDEGDSPHVRQDEMEWRRASAASEVLAPLARRVEGMFMAIQGGRRERSA